MLVSMTHRQIEIIENSWDILLLHPEEASETFYARLFFLDPSLRLLFGEDINSQAQKLVAMITFIVHKLNDLDDIMADVKDLGLRHKEYKVRPEHFVSLSSALLWTLEKRLGKLWDDETKVAWATIYDIISKPMIDAVSTPQPAMKV